MLRRISVLVTAILAVSCAGQSSSQQATRQSSGSPSGATSQHSPSPTSNRGLSGAAAEWRAGAAVADYVQSKYWLQAARDLTTGLPTDARASTADGRNDYSRAIMTLRQLASVSDTGLSPAQQVSVQRQVAALNQFFGTLGLYS